MRVFDGVADLERWLGKEIGVGDWRAISQADINTFAELTEDRQWIHTDPVKAARGPFGAPVAHGYLTLSLLPVLVSSVYRVDGLTFAVNYGSNRVRYPSAVPSGSLVRARVELIDLSPGEGWMQSVTRVTVERQADEPTKPACVADIVTRLYTMRGESR
jgi:acyl dehydratase